MDGWGVDSQLMTQAYTVHKGSPFSMFSFCRLCTTQIDIRDGYVLKSITRSVFRRIAKFEYDMMYDLMYCQDQQGGLHRDLKQIRRLIQILLVSISVLFMSYKSTKKKTSLSNKLTKGIL